MTKHENAGDVWLLSTGKQVNGSRKRLDLLYNSKFEENLLEEARKDAAYDFDSDIEKDLFIKFLYLSPYEIKLNRVPSSNELELISKSTTQLPITASSKTQMNAARNDDEHNNKRVFSPLLRLSLPFIGFQANACSPIQVRIMQKQTQFQKATQFEDWYTAAYNQQQ